MTTPVTTDLNNADKILSAFYPIMNRLEFEDLIRRQGYVARILHAYKCNNCGENHGTPSFACLVCGGTGYVHRPQLNQLIIAENVKHTGENIVYPKFTPVQQVKKLVSTNRDHQERYTDLTISPDGTQVTFNGDYIPPHFSPMQMDYTFRRTVKAIDEQAEVLGPSDVLASCQTAADQVTHNQRGDLIHVSRVYNVTQDVTYIVLKIYRQQITVQAQAPILDTDEVRIDYEYAPLSHIIATNKTFNRMTKEWSDLPAGKMLIVVPAWMNIGEGDIITLLGTRVRRIDAMKRDVTSQVDQLRSFDVQEIVDVFLPNNPSIVYVQGVDYKLRNYNEIVWLTSNKPVNETEYSIEILYSMSVKPFEEVPLFVNAHDQQLPKSLLVNIFDFTRAKNEIKATSNTIDNEVPSGL